MNYLDTYNIWKSKHLEDPDLIAEMVDIEGNDHEIKERFVKMLEFGTAGLRGILGVGTNRMNIYTVALATQGMADYVKEKFENPSVAIAYDSRIKSDLFANVTARVFAANGVKAYLFKELMPTPTLSFAVRQLHCSAGIVITASHNPSKYNGYKAYGEDGCQLNPQAAAKVLELASKTDIFDGVKKISLEEGLRTGMIEYISDELVDQYLDRVFALRVSKAPVEKSDLKVVYTPLNGTGNKLVRRILQRIGARHIINAETDAGKRVGHLVAGNYLDYIEIDGPYTVVKVHTPLYAVGRSIEDVQVHDKYGVTVVGLKAPGKEFQYGFKELVMHRNDELILMGKQDQIDHFIQG